MTISCLFRSLLLISYLHQSQLVYLVSGFCILMTDQPLIRRVVTWIRCSCHQHRNRRRLCILLWNSVHFAQSRPRSSLNAHIQKIVFPETTSNQSRMFSPVWCIWNNALRIGLHRWMFQRKVSNNGLHKKSCVSSTTCITPSNLLRSLPFCIFVLKIVHSPNRPLFPEGFLRGRSTRSK